MSTQQDLSNEITELKRSVTSDLDVKIAELAIKRTEKKTSVFQNPLILSIISALIALAGLLLGKIEDSKIQANQQKVKFESDLILHAVTNVQGDTNRLHNLEFIMRLGLISSEQLKDSVSELISKANSAIAKKDTQGLRSLLQYTSAETNPIPSGNIQAAAHWDSIGFAYLFNKDVSNAIIAFNNAEQSYNGYHTAYDIWFYLRENKTELESASPADWKNIYSYIFKNYSWKMPEYVKSKLKELSQ